MQTHDYWDTEGDAPLKTKVFFSISVESLTIFHEGDDNVWVDDGIFEGRTSVRIILIGNLTSTKKRIFVFENIKKNSWDKMFHFQQMKKSRLKNT